MRGKLLNVRAATQKRVLENAEIKNLIKILGLDYEKKYDTEDDVKLLRYGKVMIISSPISSLTNGRKRREPVTRLTSNTTKVWEH